MGKVCLRAVYTMRVPRFRDLDENRPGCTCVRSLEKRPIRFAILDQPIVPQNRSYLSCTHLIYITHFFFPFFKFQNSQISLSLKISIPKSKRQKIPPVPRFRRTVAPGIKKRVSVSAWSENTILQTGVLGDEHSSGRFERVGP